MNHGQFRSVDLLALLTSVAIAAALVAYFGSTLSDRRVSTNFVDYTLIFDSLLAVLFVIFAGKFAGHRNVPVFPVLTLASSYSMVCLLVSNMIVEPLLSFVPQMVLCILPLLVAGMLLPHESLGSIGFVEDGAERLYSGLEERISRIVLERYAEQIEGSRWIGRWLIMRKVKREIEIEVKRQMDKVSDNALF